MSLRAYSVALKNLEAISKEEKEKHLQIILKGWATTMRYACMIFKDIIESKELDLGGLKFDVMLPERVNDRMLRFMFLTIPVIVASWMRRDLGSQKLSLQLRNALLAPSLSERYLQIGLYADLKLNEYITELDRLRKRCENSTFFSEALLVRLRDIYLRLGLQDNEQQAFLTLAAEISADIKGLSGEERTRHMSKYVEDLRKREQVYKLRDASI
jgi:hypothetical protein